MMTSSSFFGSNVHSRYRRLSAFESKAVSAAMIHDGFRGAGRGTLYPTPILPQQDNIAAALNAMAFGLSSFAADSQFEDSIMKPDDNSVDVLKKGVKAFSATTTKDEKQKYKSKKSPGNKRRIGSCGDSRIYIDQVKDEDILCGRGGRSNHHIGNKRYRQVVNEMKMKYKCTEGKLEKTDLSKTIVEYVSNYGGRFIKKDEQNGKYYLLTPKEARRKTSQALREAKNCKWMTE